MHVLILGSLSHEPSLIDSTFVPFLFDKNRLTVKACSLSIFLYASEPWTCTLLTVYLVCSMSMRFVYRSHAVRLYVYVT